MLAKLISIFLFRTLSGEEHKISVNFTKDNIVNLFLTLHILYITDDRFILSMLGTIEIRLEMC
jgi:hypothetical protein